MTGTMSADTPTAWGKERPRARGHGPCVAWPTPGSPGDRSLRPRPLAHLVPLPRHHRAPRNVEQRHPAIQERGVLQTTQESTQGGGPGPHEEHGRTVPRTTARPHPAQPPTANGCPWHRTPHHGAPGPHRLYLQELRRAPAGSRENALGPPAGGGKGTTLNPPARSAPRACPWGKWFQQSLGFWGAQGLR